MSISGPNGELNQHGWVDDVVLVLDDAGTIQHRYLHGPLIDQVFADETAGGEVLWSLADHLGTVRDWARRADFDSNGTQETQVVNHVKFSAFSDVISQTSGTTPPLHSYTGQLWDADADMIYYRARWYDPTLGRFVSEDHMGFEAGDGNLSRYVGNNSQSFIDASGLSGTSKGGSTGTPLPPFNLIGPGFPKTLPPKGQTTVVIGQRGTHTFLILLNENGQTRFFSGQPNSSGVLEVHQGPYGQGAEPYMPTDTIYSVVGNTQNLDLKHLDTLAASLNSQTLSYSYQTNNCNTTACQGIEAVGLRVPLSPTPGTTVGTPGWGPTTK